MRFSSGYAYRRILHVSDDFGYSDGSRSHVQRGGTPSAFDRVLCTRLGVAAVTALHEGIMDSMVAVRNDNIVCVPLKEVVGKTRYVDLSLYDDVATVFFG